MKKLVIVFSRMYEDGWGSYENIHTIEYESPEALHKDLCEAANYSNNLYFTYNGQYFNTADIKDHMNIMTLEEWFEKNKLTDN